MSDEDNANEEGEEEEPRCNDPYVEPETKSEFSRSAVRAPAPQVSFGSLAKVAEAPKRKAVKRKQPEADEEDSAIDLEADEAKPSSADPLILQVPRLKLLVEMLNSCPPCFLGLVPDRILCAKEKSGHQLRGVGFFQKEHCCLPTVSL